MNYSDPIDISATLDVIELRAQLTRDDMHGARIALVSPTPSLLFCVPDPCDAEGPFGTFTASSKRWTAIENCSRGWRTRTNVPSMKLETASRASSPKPTH